MADKKNEDLKKEEIKENTAEKKSEKKSQKQSEKKSDKAHESYKAKYEELEKKYSELDDKYFRLAAEYTNFQKRTSREKDELYTSAVSDTVEKLLPVLDNIERAVSISESATDVSAVCEGVKLVSKMTHEIFEKLGVTPIEAVGKPFDAQLHNAVMHVEDDSVGENTVVEEFMRGYKKGDRVIRYSMVKVAN